jgi:hypothetical protein
MDSIRIEVDVHPNDPMEYPCRLFYLLLFLGSN